MPGYYSENQEESGFELKGKWQYILITGILVVVWFIFHGQYGNFTWDKVTVGVGGAFALMVFTRMANDELKHLSPKIITNPIYSTISGEPSDIIAGYAVFRLGGVNALAMHWDGSDGTAIVPQSSVNNIGKCVVCTVRVERIEKEEIPFQIRNELLIKGYPEPFFLGLSDEELVLNVPEATFHMNEIKQQNRHIEMLDRKLKEALQLREDIQEQINRIGLAKRGGTFDRLLED